MEIIKDVNKDGNCLLWSIMASYLEQAIFNEDQFKQNYKRLFGTEKGWERSFVIFFMFDDQQVKLFRNRIVDYIARNLDTKRPDNKAIFRTMLSDSDINKKNKEKYPDYNEELQIKTTLEQMRKNGEITGSIEIEVICNMLNCKIIRENKNFKSLGKEVFEPDYSEATSEIKIEYENGHYKYFSNISNDEIENRNISNLSQFAQKNSFETSVLVSTQSNDNFLFSARLQIKNGLSKNDEIKNGMVSNEDIDAMVNLYLEEIIKVTNNQKNNVLKKVMFEIENQDKLFTNPNLSFDSFIKPMINQKQENTCKFQKEIKNTNNVGRLLKVF